MPTRSCLSSTRGCNKPNQAFKLHAKMPMTITIHAIHRDTRCGGQLTFLDVPCHAHLTCRLTGWKLRIDAETLTEAQQCRSWITFMALWTSATPGSLSIPDGR